MEVGGKVLSRAMGRRKWARPRDERRSDVTKGNSNIDKSG